MGNGRAPHKSRRARTKKYTKEGPSNVSEEAEKNVIEEENGSCAELVKAFKCSTISTTTVQSQSDLSKTSIENLPEELLTNIFTRILAKQLAQMRCVQKTWNTLLSQPSFIKTHLNHSYNNNKGNQILMAFNSSVCPCDSTPYRILNSPSPNRPHNKLPRVSQSRYTAASIKVIGAVNGLLCTSNNDQSIIKIGNISLSAMSTLPPSSTPSPRTSQIFLRFGFDPETDDYKVVKITGIADIMKTLSATRGRIEYPYGIKKWLQVEVYSMKKGAWELITARVPSHFKILIDTDQLSVDGHDAHLHWLACSSKGGNTDFDSIATFNLGLETFGEIRFPDSSTLNHHNYINVVGVLGGKLCVMLHGDDGAYEVWVMEEYGVYGSWVKRHAFSLSTYYTTTPPFGFTLQNELLIEHDDGYLFLYDPCTKKRKYFPVYCCRERERPSNIVENVDSLVWVVPAKHEAVDA